MNLFSISVTTFTLNCYNAGLNYSSMLLEQPTLEIIATDKFGIMQTGKRPLTGLTTRYSGAAGLNYPINMANGELYGKAFQCNN